MTQIRKTAGLSVATLLFFGAPLAFNSSGAAVLDIWGTICSGVGLTAAVDGTGNSEDHDHQTGESNGLYMPMFSSPPKGGKIYNGPPLDEC